MKEQIKTPEKELSKKKIANLSDAEFKILVIRMLTEMIWVWLQNKWRSEGYAKQNNPKYTANQQLGEENQDSGQQFVTKGRNKHSAGTEWRNKNSKKWGEAQESLGQLETLQHPNHRGARRRGRTKNWKLIWTNNEGELPQSGEGNRLLGSPGSSESPKEARPKEEHTTAHHNYITQD